MTFDDICCFYDTVEAFEQELTQYLIRLPLHDELLQDAVTLYRELQRSSINRGRNVSLIIGYQKDWDDSHIKPFTEREYFKPILTLPLKSDIPYEYPKLKTELSLTFGRSLMLFHYGYDPVLHKPK